MITNDEALAGGLWRGAGVVVAAQGRSQVTPFPLCLRPSQCGYVDSGDGYATLVATGVLDRFGGSSSFDHDAAGRQTAQLDRDETGATIYQRAVQYGAGGRILGETVVQRSGQDTLGSTVANTYGVGAGLGQVVTATTASHRNGQYQGTTTTNNGYDWRGGVSRLFESSSSGAGPGSVTRYTYGAANQLEQVTIADGRTRTVTSQGRSECEPDYVQDVAGRGRGVRCVRDARVRGHGHGRCRCTDQIGRSVDLDYPVGQDQIGHRTAAERHGALLLRSMPADRWPDGVKRGASQWHGCCPDPMRLRFPADV